MSEVDTPAQNTSVAGEETKAAVTSETPAQAQPEAANPEVQSETTEAKPAEAKPVVPEKYDLKMPEGSKLPETQIEKISAYAKEKGLSNELAQDLLNRESALVAEHEAQQVAELKAKSETWFNEIKNDKEFGGEKLKETVEFAKRSVEHFGDDVLKKALNETGLGNHPSLLKMHAKIGRLMANDKFFATNADGVAERSEDRLYPTVKKK